MSTARQEKATRRIEEILRKRGSMLAGDVAKIVDVRTLNRDTRKAIVDELGNEFCTEGLKPNSEPNDYGLEIENLIDVCNLREDF